MERHLTVAAVVALLVLASTNTSRACEHDFSPLLGVRDFTTEVAGSKNGKGLGTNGYYRVEFVQNGCNLVANIAKLGYTGVRFPREKIQYGTFPATVYNVQGPGEPRLAALVDASLNSDTGSSLQVGFTFVGDFGHWRYLGSSWDKYGFWGPLVSSGVASRSSNQFQAPEKLRCDSRALDGAAGKVAALLRCGPVLSLATADLSRILWFHPVGEYSAEGIGEVTKIIETGQAKGTTYVAYCTKYTCDHPGCDRPVLEAQVVGTDGRRAGLGNPTDAMSKKCGARTKPQAPKDRWGGTIQ